MEDVEVSNQGQQPPLVDSILQYGQQAFDPELPESVRALNKPKFHLLLQSTGTLVLLPALNLLVQPRRTHPWLRSPLISYLAAIPLRERGVQTTIEFVLSVHPSSAGYNTTANAGKGSGITHEALNAISRLLSSPPSGMEPEAWFCGIAPQLLSLLQGEGEQEMDRAAAYVIGFGILGRKQYGAPGTAGWKAFVEPIFRSLDPSLATEKPPIKNSAQESIITLGAGRVLSSSSDITRALSRLTKLLTSHPNPALTKRLLSPILLPLWSLASWQSSEESLITKFSTPARSLLRMILQLAASNPKSESRTRPAAITQNLQTIVQSFMFRGRSGDSGLQWIYVASEDGGIEVQKLDARSSKPATFDTDLLAIDQSAGSFVSLIEPLTELESEISQLFMSLCRKWLSDETNDNRAEAVLTHAQPELRFDGVENRLIEAQIMQKMISLIPGKLIDDSQKVLELVDQVLANFVHGGRDGGEDNLSVSLSLLNLVLTSRGFRESPSSQVALVSIETSLSSINKFPDLEISSTIQNMLLLLHFRRTIGEPEDPASVSRNQGSEDRKSYNLALSYLTATDSPPPVRVQGLDLISSLIKSRSSVLDIPSLLVLFTSLLQDSDEYIYLRVIKSFTELSRDHPKTVVKDLVEHYVDPNEDYELDQRLRFGEALLQVIQNSKLIFSGEISRVVCEGLLSIAGRRGYRPKTEVEQEKRNKLKRKNDKDAEEAWGGEVPQFEDDLTPENEILAQIVSGWESKRGTEDIRIRASALSILAFGFEANTAGVGPILVSTTVDLSIHILTLEPEPEKGILRRSAILLIMSFVRALEEARIENKNLGFGFIGQSLDDVQRVLKFIAATDNDGLVRQHARDVVEGLETWQTNSLLQPRTAQVEIQELAGLSINPLKGSPNVARPKIEEIE